MVVSISAVFGPGERHDRRAANSMARSYKGYYSALVKHLSQFDSEAGLHGL